MNILLLEPYFTGSHAAWAQGYSANSRHSIRILGLKGQFWKWRMHGGAVSLAKMFQSSDFKPDLILATDMLDLTTFLALTRNRTANLPVALYFHENQISYPWSPDDGDVSNDRDMHYGFINYTSALSADAVCFNSNYHLKEFVGKLTPFLKQFPDQQEMETVDEIQKKSGVLHLGLDLERLRECQFEKSTPDKLILWNHRWEYDKNPDTFFKALIDLHKEGIHFQVAILGEDFEKKPDIFFHARDQLGDKVVQFGYVESVEEYARWLWKADIIPVTSNQEFFGASVVEAIFCGCFPLLPKRLSYPSLFPMDKFADCYYEDNEDMLAKLRMLLRQSDRVPVADLMDHVEIYDWEFIAPKYDRCFERLVEKLKGNTRD